MKKTILKLVSLLMIAFVASFTFIGCGNSDFDGNYEKATADSLYEALKDIDFDKLYGDQSSEDWAFGFEYVEESCYEAYSEDKDGNIEENSTDYSLEQVLSLSLKKVEDETLLVLKGYGELAEKIFNYEKEIEVLEEGEDREPEVYEGEAENVREVSNQFDGDFVYIDGDMEYEEDSDTSEYSTTGSQKYKYDLTTDLGQSAAKSIAYHYQNKVGEAFDMFYGIDFSNEEAAKLALQSRLDYFEEIGMQISLDTEGDYIKIKTEIADLEKFIESIKEEVGDENAIVEVDEMYTVVVLTKDGLFKACKSVNAMSREYSNEEFAKYIEETDEMVEIHAYDGDVKDVKKADSYKEGPSLGSGLLW